jgi:hypothetical protein
MRKALSKLWVQAVLWAPYAAGACPRCVDATPYKTGMLVAVLVLLPLPLTMGFFLYRWIQKAEKEA